MVFMQWLYRYCLIIHLITYPHRERGGRKESDRERGGWGREREEESDRERQRQTEEQRQIIERQ